MTDALIIRNGTVYDGTGSAPIVATVTVRGGRIVSVGPDSSHAGAVEIDASGMAVAPGFIDMHTHSDVSVLSDPDCVSAIGQGITSQIVGHCGFSAAPTDEVTRRSLVAEEPVFGFPGGEGHPSGAWGWDTIGEYLDVVKNARPRTNIGTLVGHNTLRRLVVGSENRPPAPAELDRMCHLAAAALQQGALGVSTGLSYAPGLFAEIGELVALASVASRAGRRYHTHMRYGDQGIRGSLREAIETATRAECPVNVSHLYPSRSDHPTEVVHLLEMIDEVNDSGGDVTFDLTLFQRGGGAWMQFLPPWAREGGVAATVERIRDPSQYERLLGEIRRELRARDWEDDLIVKVNETANSALVGRSIASVAEERGVEPDVAALMLVEEDGQFWVAPTIKRQDDLDALVTHPLCIPVTDGMSAHPERHAQLGLMPKTFGTFPLLLGDYVRQRGVLTLADAIARSTSLPARRLGLTDRGLLAEGCHADIVIFDPASVANVATDDRPGLAPAGIGHVIVNGVPALRDGVLTADRRGEVLT